MNLSKCHLELDRLFDIFNENKFENKLEKPIIIIQSTGKKPLYGYCTLNKIWSSNKENSESLYELGISAEHLSRSKYEICGTLIHEMVHLLNLKLEVKDVAPNYIYHNKKFKVAAEQVGLIINKAPVIGWSVTTLSDELKAFIDTLNIDEEIFSYFRTRLEKPKTENKYKQYKFQCANCDEVIYSKNKDGSYKCSLCESYFYLVEKN